MTTLRPNLLRKRRLAAISREEQLQTKPASKVSKKSKED